jgi:septal ring factor EnvC (AmiA/AmiB activator)
MSLLKKFSVGISFLICLFQQSYASTTIDINSKKNQLSTINSQISLIQKNLNQELAQQTELENQLKLSEQQIESLSKDMLSLNQKLETEQNTILRLQSSQATFIKQLNRQHAALGEQVRFIFHMNQTHPIKALLNADDLNVANRHLYYQHYFSDARINLTTKIKTTLNLLISNLTLMTEHKQMLTDLLTHKKAEHVKQQIAFKKHQHLYTLLNQKTLQQKIRLANLVADQKQLLAIMSALNNQLTEFPTQSFQQLKGKLHWPLSGKMLTSYGSSLGIKDQRSNGVVIATNQAHLVHTVSAGKVIFANWLRGFGLLIIVNHGNGYMSLYGRNERLNTKTGDFVTPQDVIAIAGPPNTNLYFEIRHNGLPVNPNDWCG